jgi:Na+-transporting methylmalonyl-CoA/oxaloacetate decarboxylase gamma subunit
LDEENKAVEEVQTETPEVKEESKVEKIKPEEPKTDSSGGKGKAVLAVAAVIILLILVTKFGGKKENTVTLTETPTPTVQITTYKVGEEITAGSAVITISKVEVSEGTEMAVPAEGNEWLNVSMTIENTGEEKQILDAAETMLLKDAEGNSYEVASTDKATGVLIDGTVAAGGKKTGWVGFEVKAGAKGLQLFYNASAFGGEEILVSLGE